MVSVFNLNQFMESNVSEHTTKHVLLYIIIALYVLDKEPNNKYRCTLYIMYMCMLMKIDRHSTPVYL